MNERIKEILSWYGSDNPGTLTNIARIFNHGILGGTGKLVILPVDQGFEHGPARSFAPNPRGYNPLYHFELALDAGCSAYAAPLGFIEAAAREYPGEIPLILKCNSSDGLFKTKEDYHPAVYGTVEDALRLGCSGVGYTIYPGSTCYLEMYEELADLAREAKEAGLVVVVWSYPRGPQLTKEDETAVDVVAYAAQIAAQLGAHFIKVKPPSARVAQAAAKKTYEKYAIPISSLSDRVKHIVQSAFDGRRVVIFSGGPAKEKADILQEVKEIHKGGGFGSIIGRNSFQRQKDDAVAFLHEVMEIYKS